MPWPLLTIDLDGRNAFGHTGSADTTTKSFEQSQTESTPTSTTAHGVGSTNHGPHNSNLMNKLDPRVDSDRGKFILSVDRLVQHF